jgi:DNA-binding transcriptional ArsR family regulator
VRSKQANGPLDHIFYALSDPTRRRILTTLSRGQANVTELVGQSNLTFPTISKHLKVLERAKLIRRRSDSADARAFVFEPEERALERATDWLDEHRRYWNARFDELETFVAQAQRKKGRRS